MLEPSAHDVFKFRADSKLQQALPKFGDVTDVATHAGMSTVTMGHGPECVMYNTLNGQSVEFLITAKECNGRKRTEGGDVFEVEISTQGGEKVFNASSNDCGNGTYSFCFTPNHGNMNYQMSVLLNGCHVKGSPFVWYNGVWNLCSEVRNVYGDYSEPYIELGDDGMTATYCQRSYYHHQGIHWGKQRAYNPFEDDYDGKVTVFGSSSFHFGKHGWMVRISGNVTGEFAFGVGVSPETRCPCVSQWTWSSGNKNQPSSPLQQSTITGCMDNDVIEIYLDCDNKTLMMYNQRTKQTDTWEELQGELRPIFELCYAGNVVSLPCQVQVNAMYEEE